MPNIVPLLVVYVLFLLVLLGLRLQIALALALVGFVGLLLFRDPWTAGKIMAECAHSSLNSFTLTAVPIFLLMAEIISRGGAGKILYDGVSPLVEDFLPGGLIHANIVACAIFGGVCGSQIGDAAAIGSIAVPELKQRGYNMPFAAASLAAAGPLASIIPPSLGFIIFGAVTGVSVGKLFIAGIIPGIILTGLYMLATVLSVAVAPGLAPRSKEKKLRFARHIWPLAKITPIILLALGMAYAIYGGIATPTEVGMVGAIGAMVISAGYRQLSWRMFVEVLGATVRTTGIVLFLYVGASIYATSLAHVGLATLIGDAFGRLPVSPLVIGCVMLLLYILLGMFIDGISLVVVVVPITFPTLMMAGFDPLQIGVFVVLMGAIGAITPPVGLTLYVLQAISGIELLSIAKASIPFMIAIAVATILCLLFPTLSNWLPSFMG